MMKSLLLAGAAGLATVSLAQAADVPMDKAEAVEYVKVCSEFNTNGTTGFFYMPGTDTCLKIGGRVRATYSYTDDSGAVDDTEPNLDFASNAMLSFDARTATELGTLRSFIEVSADDGKGLSVGKAFIQLGGLTAGYAASMFDSGIGVGDAFVGTAWASDKTTNLLAYTASFGGGFLATVSIEEGTTRRNPLAGYQTTSAGVVSTKAISYAGHDMPDFVFALSAEDQPWGKAKVMAAFHQISYLDSTTSVGDEYGYAVGAGVELKAAGFTFGLQGNYADGAMGYLDESLAPDAVVYGTTSETSSGYVLASSVGFTISPALLATVFGSYKDIDWATPGTLLTDIAGDAVSVPTNYSAYSFGANATYVVTPGLKMILEAAYTSADTKSSAGSSSTTTVTSSTKTVDSTSFGVRLQREF